MANVIETECGNTTVLADDSVEDVFHLDEAAIDRIHDLLKDEAENTFLRIAVQGGGCAGFQHLFGFDTKLEDDDYVITSATLNGPLVVIDSTSMQFLKDSTLRYLKEIGGEFFKIDNPHMSSSCGCGKSFGM